MPRSAWVLLLILALGMLSGCERRHVAQARRHAQAVRQAMIQEGVHLYSASSPQSGRHFTLRRLGKLYRLVDAAGHTQARASLRRIEGHVLAQTPGGTPLGRTRTEDHAIALLDPQGQVLLRLRIEADGLHMTLLNADNAALYTFELTQTQEVVALPVCAGFAPEGVPGASAANTFLKQYFPGVIGTEAQAKANCDLSPLIVTVLPTKRLTLSSLPDADHPQEMILSMEPSSGLHPLGFALLNLSQLPPTQLLPLALHADLLGLPPPPKSS